MRKREIIVRFDRRDFTFVEQKPGSNRFVHVPHVGRHIHLVEDHRSGRQRRWMALSKSSSGWSGMGQSSRFLSAQNAARAALEFWGF